MVAIVSVYVVLKRVTKRKIRSWEMGLKKKGWYISAAEKAST